MRNIFFFFAPNPALSGLSHTAVPLICWVISWGQSQNKVSHGRSGTGGAVPPLKALPEKDAPRPNYHGPRRRLPHKPVGPGVVWWYLGLQLWLDMAEASWTCWHLQPRGSRSSEYAGGKGKQSHITRNSSVQERSVNLRSSNSQSQPVTFRKPFQVLLRNERLSPQYF